MRTTNAKRWREPKAWIEAVYDPGMRAAFFQVLLAIAIALLAYGIVTNTIENLRKQNIASGFGFLSETAGFDISQILLAYSSQSTYGEAFLVGLTNTLLVAFIGIVIATILGFAIGIARLSSNWLVAKLALSYVELVRNLPLLLQLLIWYVAVLRTLPLPQDALSLPGGTFLDVRGLHLPRLGLDASGGSLIAVLALAIGCALWLRRLARRDREAGRRAPRRMLQVAWALVIVAPLGALAVAFATSSVSYPVLGRFNHEGGLSIEPEFLALLIGLSTYTAAFIAEIVRAGLQGVPRGQREAAAALGLSRRQALRLVILPQSLRIIIPPLTNQYLNLTKNSSLAVAIGYPDLVSVFSGTVLNQTGQAVEVILITMAVYLAISLATAAFMNWFNLRTAWAER